MEILKRKKGFRYREMIWINGEPIKSPSFTRKGDCIQWLAQQRSKKHEIELYGDSKKLRETIPFSLYAENWILAKISAGLAPGSIENYRHYLRVNIAPYFSSQDIKKIQKEDIEKMQRELSRKHNAKGANNIMAVVKSIFKDAHRDGYLVRNPAEYIPKLKEPPRPDTYWTKPEIDQFLKSNIGNPLYDFFLLALNTGLRLGELGALQWDRVDFSLNQISVTRTRDKSGVRETTKSNLRRIVPMNSVSRACLLKLFKTRTASPFVFTKADGEWIDIHHVYRDLIKAKKKALITSKLSTHGLRHTFASQFMMNGGNIFDLQKILGHADLKETQRYAHLSNEHLQKAISGFELGGISNEPNQILTRNLNDEEKVVCL